MPRARAPGPLAGSATEHSGWRLYLRSVAVCVVSRSVNCCVALGRIIKLVYSHLCPGASTLHLQLRF